MIKANNIFMIYDGNAVIEGASFELPDTGIVAIAGCSGAGKTTLLRMLCGLTRPLSGTIEGLPDKVAVVFQEQRLIPWLSALDNIKVAIDKKDGDESILAMLATLGIKSDFAHKMPNEMSGGERQRVCLARAFLYDSAKLLLLDEPFSGLDENCREVTKDIIKEISKEKLVVLVSHIKEDVDIAQKVISI